MAFMSTIVPPSSSPLLSVVVTAFAFALRQQLIHLTRNFFGCTTKCFVVRLVVLGYVDQGVTAIIDKAVETDSFASFSAGDGMVGDFLIDTVGDGVEGMIATRPGSETEGFALLSDIAAADGLDADGPYIAEAYDAAAILGLALAVGGDLSEAIRSVANAPGEVILPGELDKALEIIASGGDVDYQGATNIEFDAYGDTGGAYLSLVVENGDWVSKGMAP